MSSIIYILQYNCIGFEECDTYLKLSKRHDWGWSFPKCFIQKSSLHLTYYSILPLYLIAFFNLVKSDDRF